MKKNDLNLRKIVNTFTVFLLLFCTQVPLFAQERAVSGVIRSAEDGSTIPGVNVFIKGTTSGTVTDFDGEYKINIPESIQSPVLVFSYIGYTSQEIPVGDQSVISPNLAVDTKTLEDVVVTALGVERETKALGYATQSIDGKELTQARETNLVNSMAGKIAGVQVVNSGSTLGDPQELRSEVNHHWISMLTSLCLWWMVYLSVMRW